MTLPAIRAARPADLAGILELYQHLNADDPTPEPAKVEAAWASLVRAEGITILVTEMAGVLVATATLVVIPNLMRGTQPYALIENVVSHRAHRGQGLGRGILRAALDAAWQAGCYKVMLVTGSTREETWRFYEGLGFRRNGKTFFEIRPA